MWYLKNMHSKLISSYTEEAHPNFLTQWGTMKCLWKEDSLIFSVRGARLQELC